MKKQWNTTLIIVLLFLISSCNGRTTPTPEPGAIQIISLREVMPILESEAKAWKSDAYLEWADIVVRLDYPENYPVVAGAFNSPSSEYESLLVTYAADGALTPEIVEHEIPVYQQAPITLDDWPIDSQEALDLMVDQDGLAFIRNNDSQCSFLKLERRRYLPEQPLVWRLTITECFGDFVRHIHLDPITGEILEDS